ncbi:lithostathine-1-beta [Nothobranchius furzeri]|uniref:Transcript variant X1 n=1 Tax=Nothobranchius furzeri TaxID=105023 RepID=A0A9D2YE19_NOTFU|nr:transcript variant X1 [Nothobranchius furzeri]KAF7219091.1 transcript variant X2 [Nothobranchius furzeri]
MHTCRDKIISSSLETMCTYCCITCTSQNTCDKSKCKKRSDIPMKPDGISTVNVNFKDSSNVDVTDSTETPTGSFLMFYDEPKSWIDAFQYCNQMDNPLVEMTNQTVRDEMNRVLANRTGLENGVWIGLERSMFGTDVNWMWASGSRAENPGWNFSFPVDRWNNHCGKAIWLNESREIKLLDENCHEKLPYICQDL